MRGYTESIHRGLADNHLDPRLQGCLLCKICPELGHGFRPMAEQVSDATYMSCCVLIGYGRVLENYNSILLVSRFCDFEELRLKRLIATNMQTDTSLSSTETVIQNIYGNFIMAAMRSVSYLVDIDYLAQGNLNSVTGRSSIYLANLEL
jgi:hypothetical protein